MSCQTGFHFLGIIGAQLRAPPLKPFSTIVQSSSCRDSNLSDGCTRMAVLTIILCFDRTFLIFTSNWNESPPPSLKIIMDRKQNNIYSELIKDYYRQEVEYYIFKIIIFFRFFFYIEIYLLVYILKPYIY